MEVLLKKSKITSSILKQAFKPTDEEMCTSEILGWCLFNKLKYIVFHKNGVITKYPLFTETVIKGPFENSGEPGYYRLTVRLGGSWVPHEYSSENVDELESLAISLERSKAIAIEKGQFFI